MAHASATIDAAYAAGMVRALPLPANADAHAAPAVLDIEALGFGKDSFPVEIGFVLADGHSYCSLIRPAPHWHHWGPQAERVHRIALPNLLAYGRGVIEVASHLNRRLQGMTLYCDGWAHDYVWLNVLFEAAGLTPHFKLDHLRALLSEPEAAVWGALNQQVAAEMQRQRHRASTDARVLQRTLMRMPDRRADPPRP